MTGERRVKTIFCIFAEPDRFGNTVTRLIKTLPDMKRKLIIGAILSLTTVCASAQIAPDQDWAQFGRYAADNEKITEKPLAVLMGDSITDGWDGKDPDFFPENNIICRGISGQTSSQMLIRFRQDVIDLHPKYVVILAGTNDIACNTGYITLEDILGNIQSMCELAKAHRIKPVLCSVTPSVQFGWRKSITDVAGKISELNAMIKEYARKSRIPYIDYHSALAAEDGSFPKEFSYDGVHPNLAGYKVMEPLLLRRLK